MPDWFYRTVSRPLLFRLSAEKSRKLALGFMGRLSRLPFGPALIDFLGHMRASPKLARRYLDLTFATPVGIGCRLDGDALAPAALARFGVGLIEVGPVMPKACQPSTIERCSDRQALRMGERPGGVALELVMERLARAGPLPVPLLVRLGLTPSSTPAQAAADGGTMIARLAPLASLFALDTFSLAQTESWPLERWREHVRAVIEAVRSQPTPRPVLVCVPAIPDDPEFEPFLDAALEQGAAGLVVDGVLRDPAGGRIVGLPAIYATRETIRHWRRRRPDIVLVASSAVHEPEHALQLLDDGANLLLVDTGLIYSGPALPKRINEAILFRDARRSTPPPSEEETPAARQTWFWTLLLGISMTLGGLMATVIACTRVVMPYDEEFVGMTRDELSQVNDRLLGFLTHDRVSLAGTMLAIGILYTGLSLFGVRQGLHWARQAVIWSAFAGFASFFLFLGFGYFEPFHAFVTTILFQFLLFALYAKLRPPDPPDHPNLREDWRWRRSQWGQLLFVIQGFTYILAGLVISTIGITHVFVHEDLAYMRTTAEVLMEANPRLLPLVAHDRASFGGMLIATGLAVLLSALWGFRQGDRWLWWTLLLSGLPAYVAAIGVHHAVGYTDWFHLLPAYGGSGIFALGLWLSYPYLSQKDADHRRAWRDICGIS